MLRSALGVLCSFVFVFFTAPVSQANAAASTASPKKHTSHKVALKKSAAVNRRQARSVTARSARSIRSARNVGTHKAVYRRVAYMPMIPAVPPVLSAGDLAGLNLTRDPLELKSSVALVLDQSNSEVLFEKNSLVALPIASITKLMTSLVVVESHQDMDEVLNVTEEDIDKEKNSHSRLRIGSQLTRANMLHIALMSSENRAASALGRHYPGGINAFVGAMNAKAKMLGMVHTRYVDSTGLSRNNVASARDLAKLVIAAHQHPIIRQYSTDSKYAVEPGGPMLQYKNSNQLVANPEWEIGLQKTGYISEAGRCLVMQARIEGRPIVMVFLDSKGKQSRLADAGRIRKWLEAIKMPAISHTAAAPQS